MPIATSTALCITFPLTYSCRNFRDGWRKHASRGRRYPVSHPSGVRFLPGCYAFLYSELHWHQTAEVRGRLSLAWLI
jgi:hypothetical protein